MQRSFFIKDTTDQTKFHPTPYAQGPWDKNSLHGRVVSGLIAYVAESNHIHTEEDAQFQVSRITVDLFRQPPMDTLETESIVIRSGRRIKVVDVNIKADLPNRGMSVVARGNIVMLKKTTNPEGLIWAPPSWTSVAPADDYPEPIYKSSLAAKKPIPIWQTINADTSGSDSVQEDKITYGSNAPKRAWIRETHQLIDGENTSPLVRIAQVADVANPFANSGTDGLKYINADVSLYLQRNPEGKWIGTETFYHGASDGVSVGTIALYDKLGRIGTSTVCGLAQMKG